MSGGDIDRDIVRTVSVPWIVGTLQQRRRTLLVSLAAGLTISLIVALLTPTRYSSSFSFMPQGGDEQASSGLASLAGQFGLAVGGANSSQPPQFYADLLATRGVLGVIAKDSVTDPGMPNHHIGVPAFFKVKAENPLVVSEMTVRELRKAVVTSVAAHTTGVVTVTTTTRSPQASFEIAKKLVDGLNHFNVETRKSRASEERRFVEGRLAEAKAGLRVSEEALKSWSAGNRQFAGAAELVLQRDRLQREVSLQQQIVVSLSQQFEEARIREVRDTPVITLIEQPLMPALPDPKGRFMLVAAITFLFVAAGTAFVLGRALWVWELDHKAPSDVQPLPAV